jgi:hypothetical protein
MKKSILALLISILPIFTIGQITGEQTSTYDLDVTHPDEFGSFNEKEIPNSLDIEHLRYSGWIWFKDAITGETYIEPKGADLKPDISSQVTIIAADFNNFRCISIDFESVDQPHTLTVVAYDLEQTGEVEVVRETFNLSAGQTGTYNFPQELGWGSVNLLKFLAQHPDDENLPVTIKFDNFKVGPVINLSNESFSKLSIYPNPCTTGFLKIDNKFNNLPFIVYSLNGSKLLKGIVKSGIDVSELKPGMYLLDINNTKEKFIIK